ELAETFGAARARQCLVAFADEARLIAAVRDLRQAARRVPVVMNCADPWFAERMDELENISGVRIVSEAQLALRALHWSHPPFLAAKALGQKRIHAVMLGFGRGGEAAMTDLLLSSLVTFLGKPRLTIIDPRALEIEASLALRCPDLRGSVDIVLIDPGFSYDSRIVPRAALAAAHDDVPITLVYVNLENDQRSLAAAISMQSLVRRQGWTIGPIFTRVSAHGALPDQGIAGEVGQSAGLISFGSMYDFAAGIGLFESDPDALPRQFHESYRRGAPEHAAANMPWEDLREEHRESNRRLVMHLPAKLASSGFDLRLWIDAQAAPGNFDPGGKNLSSVPSFAADPVLLERLAELEHERWMMERRLGGWQPGDKRDNVRRIHPDLRPYADLSEHSKQFDREIIIAAAAALQSVPNKG
ncbi:MAG: RyR domain-containing protein, partial [Polymorphobacter sp.]